MELIPSSILKLGSMLLCRLQEIDKNHVACTRSSRYAFLISFSLGLELGTAQENDAGQGCPRRTIAPIVQDEEELEMAWMLWPNAKKLTPLGKVELRVFVWSCGTPEQSTVQTQQAITAIKQKV